MPAKKSVVVIGGGTGSHTVLSGLKKYTDTCEVTAIVAMTDSGGSTGRLRDEFGYLPVGDVRMALAALAKEDDEHETLIRNLFLHRFDKGGEVSGHNFGNLFLVALTDMLGSEEKAIEAASRVLSVCGTVVPVTTERVHLVAEYEDGNTVTGEHEIDEPSSDGGETKITTLSITPHAQINPRAEEVILNADLIVLGPGDLYTSILANCVIDGVAEALQNTKAKLVYVTNLMTKTGQTSGMGVREHVLEIKKYIRRMPDAVFANTAALPEELLVRYATENEFPVAVNCEGFSCRLVERDFIAKEEVVTKEGDVLRRSLIRHDPVKLVGAILDEL